MRHELIPFTESHLPSAGTLLAARHARDRAAFPELPARFEDAKVATKAVETLFSKKSAFGFAAIQDGELIAYLIGETASQDWGRSGYVYLPGYGLAEGHDPELLQDLYALVGEEWNRRGCFQHYAYLSANVPDIIDAWFSLGFGRERADALLDLRTLNIPKLKVAGDFEIRQAVKGDNARLAELSPIIGRHQAGAPRWHPLLPENLPELAEGWAELAEDPEWKVWMAVNGNETLGAVGFKNYVEADDDLIISPKTTSHTAAIKESFRGKGIGSVLTWHGLEQSRKDGAEFCFTSWQTANLLAARTWPRFGFKPVAHRFARTINPMSAWARG